MFSMLRQMDCARSCWQRGDLLDLAVDAGDVMRHVEHGAVGLRDHRNLVLGFEIVLEELSAPGVGPRGPSRRPAERAALGAA